MHPGQGSGLSQRVLSETGGEQTVTLLQTEMPAHRHGVSGDPGPASTSSPANGAWASSAGGRTPPPLYVDQAPTVAMSPSGLSVTGSILPHNNLQPYLVLSFCIAMQGVYPARN